MKKTRVKREKEGKKGVPSKTCHGTLQGVVILLLKSGGDDDDDNDEKESRRKMARKWDFLFH